MTATRRLDILAMIGGVIALLAVAGQIYLIVAHELRGEPDPEQTRQAIIARMKRTEIGADFAVLTAWDNYNYPKAYARRLEILNNAVKRFPNSPRIQFRLGTLTKGPRSVEALKRVAQLDQGNALPLYLLASEAAERKSWDETISLLKQGNARPYADFYNLRYRDISTRSAGEGAAMVSAMGDVGIKTFGRLRTLACGVSDRASELHAAGHSNDALAVLTETKDMGRKLMHARRAMLIHMLVAIALIRIADKEEEQIYRRLGSQSDLARIEGEREELRYLRAGSRAYLDRLMPELMKAMGRRMAPVVSVISIFLQIWGTALAFAFWSVAVARLRGRPRSALHEVAADTLRVGKLLTLYVLAFVVVGSGSALAFYLAFSAFYSGFSVAKAAVSAIALGIAAFLPWIVILWWPNRAYRRAYRNAAAEAGVEVPEKWKRLPLEEKREADRRLAGVQGGAMIFVLLWALLVTGATKLAIGTYPWQLGPAMCASFEREERYVKDLLAGKIKVPAKYIKEAEEREAKARSKRPTSNIERPTSSGRKAH